MTADPDRRTRGGRLLAILGIVPPPVATMAALGTMILASMTVPGPVLTPWPWSIPGLVLMAIGLVLATAANLVFLKSGASPKLFHGAPALVDHGPFRLTRNPMYLSLVLTLAGAALLMGALTPWIGPIALFLWLDRAFIPNEEALLADHFGEQWDTYSARVRRWI